jgi:hypothetical protein
MRPYFVLLSSLVPSVLLACAPTDQKKPTSVHATSAPPKESPAPARSRFDVQAIRELTTEESRALSFNPPTNTTLCRDAFPALHQEFSNPFDLISETNPRWSRAWQDAEAGEIQADPESFAAFDVIDTQDKGSDTVACIFPRRWCVRHTQSEVAFDPAFRRFEKCLKPAVYPAGLCLLGESFFGGLEFSWTSPGLYADNFYNVFSLAWWIQPRELGAEAQQRIRAALRIRPQDLSTEHALWPRHPASPAEFWAVGFAQSPTETPAYWGMTDSENSESAKTSVPIGLAPVHAISDSATNAEIRRLLGESRAVPLNSLRAFDTRTGRAMEDSRRRILNDQVEQLVQSTLRRGQPLYVSIIWRTPDSAFYRTRFGISPDGSLREVSTQRLKEFI